MLLPYSRRLSLALLGVAGCLAGCTVLEPTPDRTRFYTLSPGGSDARHAAVAPAGAPSIGVRVTSVAGHLRRSAIAVRTGEHELRYAEEHRWADRLDEAAARALAAGIQREAGSRISVAVTPALRSPVPDVLVEIDLLACEGRLGAGPSALLVADWRIYQGRAEKPAASGRFGVERPGWDGADHGRLAALLAAALDDLARAIGGPALRIASE